MIRSHLPRFVLRAEPSLEATFALLAAEPGTWRPLAGGTDVMVTLENGTLAHTRFVSIRHLDELRGISIGADRATIGALATYTDIRRHAALREEWPMLVDAAAQTGGVATQNRGTIGGNIANASPAADTPPVLLAYDAELHIGSARGIRRVPYDRFHTGYKTMDLAGDELIVAISLPRRAGPWAQTFRKIGTRRAQAISKVSFAGAARVANGRLTDVRLAFGSVAPTVVRAATAEKAVLGAQAGIVDLVRLRAALETDLHPIDDLRSSRDYRLAVAANLAADFLAALGEPPRVAAGDSR